MVQVFVFWTNVPNGSRCMALDGFCIKVTALWGRPTALSRDDPIFSDCCACRAALIMRCYKRYGRQPMGLVLACDVNPILSPDSCDGSSEDTKGVMDQRSARGIFGCFIDPAEVALGSHEECTAVATYIYS